MQSNLLKIMQNVTFEFHIWLDMSLDKRIFLVHCDLFGIFFFLNRILVRFSEAKGKRKTKCNAVDIFLPKRLFWSLLAN